MCVCVLGTFVDTYTTRIHSLFYIQIDAFVAAQTQDSMMRLTCLYSPIFFPAPYSLSTRNLHKFLSSTITVLLLTLNVQLEIIAYAYRHTYAREPQYDKPTTTEIFEIQISANQVGDNVNFNRFALSFHTFFCSDGKLRIDERNMGTQVMDID